MELTFNKDGSVDIPVEGKPIRYVKETDLLAVKGGAETKVREWETKEASFNTQLAEANRLREETHQASLKAQADLENTTKKFSDYDAVKTKAGELEKELGSHKERLSQVEKDIAERIKHNLINNYGATEEVLKDKNLSQLRNLEEAAAIVGKKGGKANYDGGRAPGGQQPIETPTERARRIIEAHEEKHGRMKVATPK